MVLLNRVFVPGVMALSCALGFIGSFTALSLCEQFRLAKVSGATLKQIVFLILTSLAAGGILIWSVFYFARVSNRLEHEEEIIRYRFETNSLITSLFVIPVIAGLGIAIASTDHCFNKSKKEIMDMFITRTSSKHTIGEIKRMGRFRILFIVCTHAPQRIITGAVIFAFALCLMPYLGLSSLQFPGHVRFHGPHVAASCFMSVFAMIAGFWVFFRVLSIFSSMDFLRVLCALNGVVLCGIQYSWIAWAEFVYEPSVVVDKPSSLSASHFVVGALSAAVIFSFVMLMYVLSDLRAWLLRTSAQLRQADLALAALMKKTKELHVAQHGHFQAPLEVINYSRKFMQGPYSAKGEGGVGGMVVAPPLYNDFSFVEEASPSRYMEDLRRNGPSERNLYDSAVRGSQRHSQKHSKVACTNDTDNVDRRLSTTTVSTTPNTHSNTTHHNTTHHTTTRNSNCTASNDADSSNVVSFNMRASIDENIMNMPNVAKNVLPSIQLFTSNDNTCLTGVEPNTPSPELNDASSNV